jgi:hypothetical protein
MPGTLAWIAITVAALGWEVACRAVPRLGPRLGEVAAAIASSRAGRAALYVTWCFVGIHVFARASYPR